MHYFILLITYLLFASWSPAQATELSSSSQELAHEVVLSRAPSSEMQHSILVRWDNSLQSLSNSIFVKTRLLCRLGKTSLFEIQASLFKWEIGYKTPSSYKTVFSIYEALLSRSILDPRIALLSSRAHPPTL